MGDPFESIKDERKKQILTAALSEFSKNGFELASTRAITNAAGVSTGLLFYYFKDKRELYLELCDILHGFFINEYFGGELRKEELKKQDFFSRLHTVFSRKTELILRYPDIFSLLLAMMKDFPDDDRFNRKKILEEYSWIYDTSDSCFRTGVDPTLAKEIIKHSFDGLANGYLDAVSSGEYDMNLLVKGAAERTYIYLEFFKKHFGA